MNVVIEEADPEGPPHVALTVYAPVVQFPVPPATKTSLYAPVVAFTGTLSKSTTAPLGALMNRTTPVFGPGAGETNPVTVMFGGVVVEPV